MNLLFAVALALSIGRGIALADRRTPPTRPPSYPPPCRPSLYKIPRDFYPPVPPTDATWLDVWPDASDEFDPFWWLADREVVASVIDEMEGDFR